MKNEYLLNLIGFEKDDLGEELEKACISLGLPEGSAEDFRHSAKTFLQRREIGGHMALMWVEIYPNHENAGQSLFPMTLGHTVVMGMTINTPENGNTVRVTQLLLRKSFETVGETLACFEVCVRELREEVKVLAHPTPPNVSRKNYDVIEAESDPAQAVLLATETLLEYLLAARKNALSFAPNEALGEILMAIETLRKPISKANRKATSILNQMYEVIKAL
jgi:hypothetical protein